MDEAEPRLVAVPVQLWETPDGAILKRGCMTLQISGEYSRETVQLVLALADGDGLTREQLLLSVSETAREPVGELVDELLLRRLLIEEGEASSAPEGPLDVYYWHFGARAADVAARIGEAGLTLLGVNAISRRIAAALGAAGYTPRKWSTNRRCATPAWPSGGSTPSTGTGSSAWSPTRSGSSA